MAENFLKLTTNPSIDSRITINSRINTKKTPSRNMIVKFLKIKNNKKLASKKQLLNRNGLWNDIFKVPTQNSIPRTFFKMMARKRHFLQKY